jgi:tetratricopeptide (TPR) repeat protein
METPGTQVGGAISHDDIRRVQSVYERGQTIDALRLAETIRPLASWRGVEPCILAARIAANAGAPQLSTKLSVRAWKTDPSHPDAQAQFTYELISRRGPFIAWQRTRKWTENPRANPEQRAEWIALKAWMAFDLRDFSRAENLLLEAERLDPGRAWIRLQRARLLEAQDQVEAALEACREACRLHPHPYYRVGTQTEAHLLQILDRDEEAIALLQNAERDLQNGPLVAQLYSLLSENGRWFEAAEALDRFVTLSPLKEPPMDKWLHLQRARVSYHQGKRAEAAHHARQLDDDFHKQFASALEMEPPLPERVQLDVTFVRQHFKTCAPATLAAIGRYWDLPAEHLKLAEAMCYDGTPGWQQREWASLNGWIVREFTVTAETAVALIERGVPFAISVVDATSAHMMAVIGFDRTRGTLLLRDPGQPYVVEVYTKQFLERYQAYGPEGIIFIPQGESARLDGIALAEAGIRDAAHAASVALAKHDRPRAAAMVDQMAVEAADGPLTWEARLSLAGYDGNHAEQLRCLDRLLELFPGNPSRQLRRLGCMIGFTREERIQWLEDISRKPDTDAAVLIALARALQGDARVHAEAGRRLHRAMRLRPMDTTAMNAQADLRWEQGRLEEATEIYQAAANLEGFREPLYKSWFIACQRTGRGELALVHLEDRFKRFGARSEQPALTLAWALIERDDPKRARQILERAMELRPADGYLQLRAASLLADLGDHTQADALMDAANGKVRYNDWLRTNAEIAECRLHDETVLSCSRELLEREPLAMDVYARVARSLFRRQGSSATLAELRAASTKYPHHYGLRRMVVEWSRDEGPQAVVDAARELLAREPSDAWARRELALALCRMGNGHAALLEAQEAARIEPGNSYCFSVLGNIHQNLGQTAEARHAYRHAMSLDVDNGDAIQALLNLARTDAERLEDLKQVEQELVRQVVTGDGLLAYLDTARPLLGGETLLDQLRFAHRARPDMWHAWAALVQQLAHLHRFDEALKIALEACDRFGHLPRTWLNLSDVHRLRKDARAEMDTARRAFEMNPSWNCAATALTSVYERQNDLKSAQQVYERALRHAPMDARLHATYANLLWRQQDTGACFSALEQALRLAPAYDWAWGLLMDWSNHLGQPSRASTFARTLTAERPGDVNVWLVAARVLNQPKDRQDRLAAINRAIELNPRSSEAWDIKAELLVEQEDFEGALQACADGMLACVSEVYVLQGRQAWIEARRRRVPEAISQMQKLLAENAGYAWGWHQLGSWFLEQDKLAEATNAFEHLQTLRPHDAWVNRQLGFMRLKQKDTVGANKAFAAALNYAPTDVAAAHNLLNAQLDASDLDGAALTLLVMQTHQPGAATVAAELRLRLYQGNLDAAITCFEAIIQSPEPEPWAVNNATTALHKRGLTRKAVKALRRAIKSTSCNPQCGAAMTDLFLAENRCYRAVKSFLALPAGELQRRAAAPLVQGLTQQKHPVLFRVLMWRRRKVLSEDDENWGQVGFALTSFNRMKDAATWLSDWEQRPNLQPWMLFNHCLALRNTAKWPEATRVARHVVSKWGHRDGAADLRLFIAIEEALAGRLAEAKEHLEHAFVRPDTAYDQQMIALTRALVTFQELPLNQRPKGFADVRKQLNARFPSGTLPKAAPDIQRTFKRTGRALSKAGAGWRAWIWFRLKMFGLA